MDFSFDAQMARVLDPPRARAGGRFAGYYAWHAATTRRALSNRRASLILMLAGAINVVMIGTHTTRTLAHSHWLSGTYGALVDLYMAYAFVTLGRIALRLQRVPRPGP